MRVLVFLLSPFHPCPYLHYTFSSKALNFFSVPQIPFPPPSGFIGVGVGVGVGVGLDVDVGVGAGMGMDIGVGIGKRKSILCLCEILHLIQISLYLFMVQILLAGFCCYCISLIVNNVFLLKLPTANCIL